ncbi:hypothetical protein GOTRE_009_00410 [Gordonia terrae NBRC 100016]|uniref:Transposase n=1 Tax=Gordonia terrae NBRC 100016 TaxID=1089454 RepID=A0ABQ0H8E1_9ACTN|nr:hypothetical protein GOTRE_009_00410 [Gordonia terrae NBRC 100016]
MRLWSALVMRIKLATRPRTGKPVRPSLMGVDDRSHTRPPARIGPWRGTDRGCTHPDSNPFGVRWSDLRTEEKRTVVGLATRVEPVGAPR